MAKRNQAEILRKKGNDIYKQLQSGNFCPLIKRFKIANACKFYCQSLLASSTADEHASAYKNSASISFLQAKFKAQLGKDKDGDEYKDENEDEECKVALSDKALRCCKLGIGKAAKCFVKSRTEGEGAAKPKEWIAQIEHQLMEIVNWAAANDSSSDFTLIRAVCEAMDIDEVWPCRVACSAHMRLADSIFKQGIVVLGDSESCDGKDYKGCLGYMHDCHHPLDRAESLSRRHNQFSTLKEIRDMQEQVQLYINMCESMQAIDSGNCMINQAISDEEDLNMELILLAMDKYHEAVLLTREKDTETEAIAMSKIGMIYSNILKMSSKAHNYHFQATRLALTIISPRISRSEWYVFSSKKVEEHQARKVLEEMREEEKCKKKILKKLAGKIKVMVSEADEDAESFLRFLYKDHPHPNPKYKLGSLSSIGETKEALRKAILHYHPDSNAKHGQEWVVLCNEITKFLNQKYSCFKG